MLNLIRLFHSFVKSCEQRMKISQIHIHKFDKWFKMFRFLFGTLSFSSLSCLPTYIYILYSLLAFNIFLFCSFGFRSLFFTFISWCFPLYFSQFNISVKLNFLGEWIFSTRITNAYKIDRNIQLKWTQKNQ